MKLLFSLGIVAAIAADATFAFADDATDIATARALGQDGVLLADQGKCGPAIEKLARAEKLHHAPTTAVRLAECEIEVGRIVSGTERLERVVREPLGPNAPAAFGAAQTRAQTLLASAQPRIARLKISVRAPAGVTPSVTVDEDEVPAAVLDAERPTDPGLRKVKATARGYLPATAEVSLKDGESSAVQLVLEPDPHAPREVATTVEGPAAPDAKATGGRSALPWIALGIGGAGLVVGAVGGGIVAGKASTLDDSCPNKRCPAGSQDTLDSAKTWATISTVGFVVGGIGVASGVLMLLLGKPSSAPKSTAHVTPVLGARYVGLDARF